MTVGPGTALLEFVRLIEATPVALATERAAQDALEILFTGHPACTDIIRECRLGAAGIIDFRLVFLGVVIGVEVKIDKGQRRAIARQVERYAAGARFDAIVLATNRAMTMPPIMAGIPVRVASLGRGWL